MRSLAWFPLVAAACTSTTAPTGSPPDPESAALESRPGPVAMATSTRQSKRDVRYIDDLDAFALRDDLLALRLATFRYADDPKDARARLGFMIEDSPTLLAVDAAHRSVDLYSYVSMAVAAIQVQQAEIQQLHEELQAATKNGCAIARPRPEL